MANRTRVLLTGATGFLGHYVAEAVRQAGHDLVTAGRRDADVEFDLADPEAGALGAVAPDVVLNVAAMSAMGDCARDPQLARQVNADAVAVLAGLDARLIQVSTDLVFDGRGAPYRPTAPATPVSDYGHTKAEGEVAALRAADALVVRVPLLFGPSFDGRRGATDMLRGDADLALFTNEFRTPLHAADAAGALVELAVGRRRGVVHLAGPERVSRWDFAMRFASLHGLCSRRWRPGVSTSPHRPRDVSMFSDLAFRSLDDQLRAG